MPSRINHVSVHALNLQESVEFYIDLLHAEPIATPNFGIPVQWLALGSTQLHLFERALTPTSHHHLGITIEDLEHAYAVAERREAFDDVAFGNRLVELPGGVIQLYVRDPGGNLVELDYAGALPAELAGRLRSLGDFNPQDEDHLRGRLFV